jgi:hypothetical protein
MLVAWHVLLRRPAEPTSRQRWWRRLPALLLPRLHHCELLHGRHTAGAATHQLHQLRAQLLSVAGQVGLCPKGLQGERRDEHTSIFWDALQLGDACVAAAAE